MAPRAPDGVAGNEQRLGHEGADAALAARARDRQALQRRMIAHVVGGLAVRDLPEQFASIQVDRADLAVGGLDQRQPTHRHAAPAGVPARLVDRRLTRRGYHRLDEVDV